MSSTDGPAITVLHIDPHLCVVNKPVGMPVQPDRTGDRCLQEQVAADLGDDALVAVHRLDRPVSGVVLFARSPGVLAQLSTMFRDRLVEKSYWAIVEGLPGKTDAVTMLEHRLDRDGRSRRARVGGPGTDGAISRLRYKVLVSGDRYAMLEVWPEGGAFHQIRAQLAASGHAIKGDVKYGARRGERDRSIALHARSIALHHPVTGSELRTVAPAPSTPVWQAFLALAGIP